MKFPAQFMRGQILIIPIILLATMTILSGVIFDRTISFLFFGNKTLKQEQATLMAEAGMDYAISLLNGVGESFTGTTPEKNVGTTGTFIATVANKSATVKTITATGYIPNSTSFGATKQTIKAEFSRTGEVIPFNYATQIGSNGISMFTATRINGQVYSNMGISGVVGGSPGNSSTIYGDAWARTTITNGVVQPPSTEHELQPVLPLPTFDYTKWQDAATAGGPCPTISSGGTYTMGPCIVASGNLTISNATVTLTGPVYMAGSLTVSGSTLNLDPSFGSNGTVIVVGTNTSIGASRLNPTNPPPPSPAGYILIATKGTLNINAGASGGVHYVLNNTATFQSNNAPGAPRIRALVAQGLTMQPGAIVEFDSGLPTATFATSVNSPWVINKGTYKFNKTP